MIRTRSTHLTLLCFVAAIGCSSRSGSKDKKAAEESATCGVAMDPTVEQCIETAVCELSGRRIGVANIYERDFVDSQGLRSKHVSAQLVLFDPSSPEERTEKLFAGNTVNIGADQYCLVHVSEGVGEERGSVTLQKISK